MPAKHPIPQTSLLPSSLGSGQCRRGGGVGLDPSLFPVSPETWDAVQVAFSAGVTGWHKGMQVWKGLRWTQPFLEVSITSPAW